MSDGNKEIGFAMPSSEVPVDFGLSFVAVPIFAVIFGILGAFTQATIFIALAIIVAGMGFAYWYLTGYKIIHLSSRGMRGLGRHGQQIKLDWDVPVVIKGDIYAGRPAFAISDANRQKKTLVFPTAIAQLPGFQDALRRFAPADHVLAVEVKRLTAEGQIARTINGSDPVDS